MEAWYFGGCALVLASLIAGIWLRFFPPKEINPYIGFKTKATAKNQTTWDYAHKLCGRVFLVYSLLSIPLFIACLIVFNDFLIKNRYVIFILGFALAIGSVVIATIIVQSKTIKLGKKMDEEAANN